LRQVWGFGGEQEQIEGSQLQLAEKQDISRLTLTVGRMSVTDQFDNLENVVETYYNFEVLKGLNVSLDYQLVVDPAYNRDRGPINIFMARFYLQY
jgi:hypothetical protein